MAYSALQLITRAYYLSGIVARDLQTVTGPQISDGLLLLNSILDFKSSDLRLIPYFTEYFFTAVQGQEMYFIPNLNYIDTFTFNIGVVRYSMNDMSRKDYFSTPRVDNIQSLPFSYRPERVLNGMNVYVYFTPEAAYDFRIWGKFDLTDVTLDQDMSLTYDLFYLEYLRHALANYICNDYGVTLPDAVMRQYKEIEKKLMDVSPADLKIQKATYFSARPGMDWQSVNLYKGWWPF